MTSPSSADVIDVFLDIVADSPLWANRLMLTLGEPTPAAEV